jgi:hypothetical protein
MVFFKKILFILFLFCNVQNLQSQVLKNNGAPIFFKTGSTVIVNGDGQNAGGNITIQGNAEFRINGNFTVSTDTIRFETTALGIITGNMVIASGGIFYRNPGSLSVFGIIYNSGILYNLGGIIEIGIP